jgi:hypothetical protein
MQACKLQVGMSEQRSPNVIVKSFFSNFSPKLGKYIFLIYNYHFSKYHLLPLKDMNYNKEPINGI